MSDTEAKKYEIAYIVSGKVPEDDVVRVAGTITRVIEDLRGIVRHIEEPRKRLLFYPVKKQRQVYFGYTTFTMNQSEVNEIPKKLKFEKDILRTLVVEEEKEQPRPQSFRPVQWNSSEGLPNARVEAPKREVEVASGSPEEREAALEKIDKKLDEMFG